jgi:Zn-finger nucleic acid-binding protein
MPAQGIYREPAPRDPSDAQSAGVSSEGLLRCPYCGGPCGSEARACPHCDVELASVRCSHCFALHFPGSRFCARCGRELEPEPLLDATDAPCPRCEKPLRVAASGSPMAEKLEGLALFHECIGCGGVFLDSASLERVFSPESLGFPQSVALGHAVPTARAPSAPDVVRYLNCPVCNRLMNRVNFGRHSGIIVDVCKDHGTWFDAGELTRAIEFAKGDGPGDLLR